MSDAGTGPAVAPQPQTGIEGFWGAARALDEARRWIDVGQPVRAEELCRQILRAQPTHPDALHLLGSLLLGRQPLDLAEALLRRAVEVNPLVPAYHVDLGRAYRIQGMPDEALASFQRAYALSPDPGLRIKMALLLPVVAKSRNDLLAWRARLEREIDALTADRVTLDDPIAQGGLPAFHLAYHGLSDRHLQEKLARFYLTACPSLAWTAPHCRPGDRRSPHGERFRIGFASALFRFHTIAKVTQGIIEKLARDRFHVTVFEYGSLDDWSQRIAERADHSVQLTGSLAEMRQAIAREQLDLLFYPDIGMNPVTYFLAFARLAPVQCVSWGHPETTGIPGIDYYLSSVDLEPEGSAAEYSERLATLDHLPTYYYRPAVPADELGHQRFRFDDRRRLYVYPQMLFKLHPDFDPILGDILRRDPGGNLIVLDGTEQRESHLATLFRERFARVNPDVADRLVVRPFLNGADFLRLLAVADVLLDPPYFGGGNTTLEALAVGTPIVTWPGPFARGRTTFACFRRMGIMDGVVSTLDDYAERAVRIATDRGWRDGIRDRILARNTVIYEDSGAIREIETFFAQAIATRQNTSY